MRVLQVVDVTRGVIVGDRVKVAATSIRRVIGLLGKHGLDPGEGLWIRPSSGVHTFGMRFPIDVVGLDCDLRVVKLWKELAPYRITPLSFRVKSVLELPAGVIAGVGMATGDVMRIG